MSSIARIILLLFLPAVLGILRQVFWSEDVSHRILAIALLLLCLEQARMAFVDLQQISEVKQQGQDGRLEQFSWVTKGTIALELAGFYLAIVSPGWGTILILISLIGFNSVASIKLQPSSADPIQNRDWSERLPVLVADGVGLLLGALWIAEIRPMGVASGLLGILLIYGFIKYGVPALNRRSIEVQ